MLRSLLFSVQNLGFPKRFPKRGSDSCVVITQRDIPGEQGESELAAGRRWKRQGLPQTPPCSPALGHWESSVPLGSIGIADRKKPLGWSRGSCRTLGLGKGPKSIRAGGSPAAACVATGTGTGILNGDRDPQWGRDPEWERDLAWGRDPEWDRNP